MVKVVCLALTFGVLIVYLRSINSEFTLLITIAATIILSFYAIEYLTNTFEFFNYLIEFTGANQNFYIIIFKITGIGYLIEFSAGLLKDFGLGSLSDKLVFVGKLVILGVSLPIFYAVINVVLGLLS